MKLSRIALILFCSAPMLAAADPMRLYVSPSGNDAWSGAAAEANAAGSDGPLATITAARDKLRALKARSALPEGAIVVLRQGVYAISSAIVFTSEDSGSPGAPILYTAQNGETPVISGGRAIAGWRREGDLWAADLSDVRDGTWSFESLWVNGERRQRARTPNPVHPWGDEPVDADTFFTQGPVEETNEKGEKARSGTKFIYREGDLQAWPDLDEALFIIYHSWEISLMRVKALDTANRVVEFTGGAAWAYGQWQPDQRYFVENIRAALDQPGEWYLDRKAGTLYYWSMPGEKPETSKVIAPVAKQLLVLQGDPAAEKFVEHLRFEGLSFKHTDYTIEPQGHSDPQAAYSVSAAVEVTGARNCTIERCTVQHVANYGVWFRSGSQHNALRQCEVFDLGAGGVRMGETSDPATPAAVASHNVVDNCYIHDGGRIFRGAVGVWIGRSSYNQVTHNEICDFRYTGVSVGWSWGYAESSANHNRIELNHIHHIGRGQLNDMGGIYTLGISPGTALRGNVIHDVWSHPRLYGGWGLYTDEGSSNILIENNLVYDVRTGSFHQHYGRDNWVVNNILAYSAEPQIVRSREEDHTSFMFERNIVLFDNGNLLGSTWKNGNWIIDHNLYWDTSGKPLSFSGRTLDQWRTEGHDLHSVVADPKFADVANRDFHFASNTPALEIGFQPFDYSRAGLYGDEAWVRRTKTTQPK